MDNQFETPPVTEPVSDIDDKGHLALALFITVIVILLLAIYALAQAA